MKYLVPFFLLIFLFACNGNKTSIKENPWIKAWLKEDESWRSIQTIVAHDEQDAIVGNFTGKGIDILYVEKAWNILISCLLGMAVGITLHLQTKIFPE